MVEPREHGAKVEPMGQRAPRQHRATEGLKGAREGRAGEINSDGGRGRLGGTISDDRDLGLGGTSEDKGGLWLGRTICNERDLRLGGTSGNKRDRRPDGMSGDWKLCKSFLGFSVLSRNAVCRLIHKRCMTQANTHEGLKTQGMLFNGTSHRYAIRNHGIKQ